MIKILIAEDSPVMLQLLIHIISSDPDFKIVGVSQNGEDAIEAAGKLNPDVIAMDWQMPKLNGKEATRIIMETNPKPIVIVTGSLAVKDMAITFNMIEAGALAIVKKPPGITHPDYDKESKELLKTLKLMSEVKLVRRTSQNKNEFVKSKSAIEKTIIEDTKIKIVAIGASTGGPLVLQKILSGLPKDIPVPVLIVQHIANGFSKGFAEWLSNTTNFPMHIASHNELALPGHAYIAPDDFHIGITVGPKIILSKHKLENGMRPSVAYLFRTAAQNFGFRAVGVLLTGMGRDGAEELKLMREKGAVTFAQDQDSSVVFGMPGEAIKLNAATHILSPEEISISLSAFINKMNK